MAAPKGAGGAGKPRKMKATTPPKTKRNYKVVRDSPMGLDNRASQKKRTY